MLTVYDSNRLEVLGDLLAQLVRQPTTSPFVPETVIVQSLGIARWRSFCLIGMNGNTFPRARHSLSFDRMAQDVRRGDRSRRDDDCYPFREARLSARRCLISQIMWDGIAATIASFLPIRPSQQASGHHCPWVLSRENSLSPHRQTLSQGGTAHGRFATSSAGANESMGTRRIQTHVLE